MSIALAQQLRWVGAADAPAVRELFARIFDHEMSAALWEWKYGAGRGAGLGLWEGGELVAHYGGTAREVVAMGEPMRACQVCDVMVAAKARAALARRGPLARVTAAFLEAQIGDGLPHRIGFGFPSDRHFGVAKHLGLYAAVDEVVLLRWNGPPAAASPRWWGGEAIDPAALREGSREARIVGGLWPAMASAFRDSALGIRSAAWLRHRYGERPGIRYRMHHLFHRLTRRSAGIAVTRDHDGWVEIADLIAEPCRFALLIDAVRRAAAASGAGRVEAWITASHAHLLQHDNAERLPLGIIVPANSHTPGPAPTRFERRWFLMSGDTDFR